MREPIGIMHLSIPETNNCLILLPGTVALKARTIVMVMDNIVDIAANVVFCRMQIDMLGWLMKKRKQMKEKMKEMSRT